MQFQIFYCIFCAKYIQCSQKEGDNMASSTTNVSIRMNSELKAQADTFSLRLV